MSAERVFPDPLALNITVKGNATFRPLMDGLLRDGGADDHQRALLNGIFDDALIAHTLAAELAKLREVNALLLTALEAQPEGSCVCLSMTARNCRCCRRIDAISKAKGRPG